MTSGDQPVIGADGNPIVRPYPVDCEAALSGFLGQPVSTINRYGTVGENNEVTWNSFGWKTWRLGSSDQAFSLGGSFSWRSGKPWQRLAGAGLGSCGSTFDGCDPVQAAISSGTALYLEPRGTRDPLNSNWNVNVHLNWAFPIRGDVEGSLRLEGSNVTNNQKLQRVTSQGEVNTSRYIGWQAPRRFALSAAFSF